MAEYTVFSTTNPYSGTVALFTDGTPSIRLGQTFYQYGAGLASGSTVVGGRVWTPSGSPATTRIMLFIDDAGVRDASNNLNTTPDASVEVATNAGGWTEARWTGVPVPPLGMRWMIAYEFVENNDAYVFSTTAFPDNPGGVGPQFSQSGLPFCLAETNEPVTTWGPVARAYYWQGTGAAIRPVNSLITYGIDTIIETSGNADPIANAGADQNTITGDLVTLNGSGSTDSDGTVVTYAWTQISGTSVTLSGSGASRTFTPSTAGTRVFGLTVTDDDGATSSQDTVTIITTDGGSVPTGTTFFGSSAPPGTWSYGTDGTPSITTGTCFYFDPGSPGRGVDCLGGRWWCPAGQAGQTVEFTLREGTVDLPNSGSGVNWNTAVVRTASVVVTNNSAHWLEVGWPTPYTLSANFRMISVATNITSSPARYHFGGGFRVGSGPVSTANLTGWWISEENTSAGYRQAWFRQGTTDGSPPANSFYGHDAILDIPVGNVPPTANAGSDQTVNTGTLVTLNGSGSTDSDGTIASYTWTQVSGTAVTLSGAGANRTFTPATTGVRVFGLTVTDDDGATSTQDLITVTVNAGANVPPTANAGADQTVNTGSVVTLTGTGSSDPDGTISTYTWTQVSGATVTLSGVGSNRTFTPATTGVRVFGLTVTDDDGATSTQDTVSITVNAAPSIPTNVVEENELTGSDPNNWFNGVDTDVPSFARSTYYLPGETAQFSVDNNTAFTTQIFRLGHYQDNGAREVAAPFSSTPAAQPSPVAITGGNGAVTCAAWSVNATWAIPATAIPGWYMALFRNAANALGYSLFQVSDKNAKRPILIVASDATWHAAYNGFGGNNVYGANEAIGSASARAFCSTYDKPVITRENVPQTHFFNNTYPYLKWSERMGYNAAHTTIEQINNDPTILDGRTLIVWTGHNEYIPQTVMNKTKALLSAGQKMVNIAGNDFFWRVKFTNGAFSSATNGRVMWCKKDTMSGPTSGPDATPSHVGGVPFTTAADWTGTWQDTRWTLREPSEDFFGDRFIANGVRADSIRVPETMKTLPPWRNCTSVQALTAGQAYSFAAGTLGMEWDMPILTNANVTQIVFSEADINLTGNAADINGENYNTTLNPARHSFAMVKKGAGYIANFNSDQWGWALDSLHLRGNAAEDANAMQMMLNVQADLGAFADTTSVVSAGLTYPTPVSNFALDYGFEEEPPEPSASIGYYSNGVTWESIGVGTLI